MSAPSPGIAAADHAAGTLLDALKTIEPAERQRHEEVLEYWLSIRGNRELPPLRDLDPLEISDAAPCSILFELIGGGEDAEIRHCGEQLRGDVDVAKTSEAPRPSLLSSVARKLSIVAVSRNALAFEDEFSVEGQSTRCSVTMLPFSAAGAWVDYVYALVTLTSGVAESGVVDEAPLELEEAFDPPAEPVVEAEEEPAVEILELEEQVEPEASSEEQSEAIAQQDEPAEVPPVAAVSAPAPIEKPGFTFDSTAAASGFYGTQAARVEPVLPSEPVGKAPPPAATIDEPVEEPVAPEPVAALPEATVAVPEPATMPESLAAAPELVEQETAVTAETAAQKLDREPQPSSAPEGSLKSKLTQVRAQADEARLAKLRANAALYEGLGAAYDFALDAEDSPEEYLRLVEAQGLKIQLRAPMRPVVKLAFEGLCDDSTIAQLEAVLAWAIDQDLPRGSLAQRIEEAGGIGPILKGEGRAAA